MIVEVGRSTNCRSGWQAGNPGQLMFHFCPRTMCSRIGKSWCCRRNLKAACWRNSLSVGEQIGEKIHSSLLFRLSTDWRRASHIMENNVLYSKSTHLSVNLIQNILIETPIITFGHIPGDPIAQPSRHIKLTISVGIRKPQSSSGSVQAGWDTTSSTEQSYGRTIY